MSEPKTVEQYMSMSVSERYFDVAERLFPGGVNSPVRAFGSVGGTPLFFDSGEGPYIHSVDGRSYVDFIGAWGPAILGHAQPDVVRAVQKEIANGFGFGAPSSLENDLALAILDRMPHLQKLRFVTSGTEAVMTAVRLARGITKRDRLVKFEGCYHGHVDALLVSAGSGALTLGVPSSPGIPKSVTEPTCLASYNNLASVEACFKAYPKDIAAVVVEPFAGNMNFIKPQAGFLDGLRALCDRYGALLIFDEVMTGFRVGLAGAAPIVGVEPDLTTLGKVIGGGLPVGAVGGKAEYLDYLAPIGPVYQAGTLSGNPIAMRCGLETLKQLNQDFYTKLHESTALWCQDLSALATRMGFDLKTNSQGGMFGFYFTDQTEMKDLSSIKACREDLFKAFFHALLKNGVYVAPSMYEAGFVSGAHDQGAMACALLSAEKAFQAMKKA